MRYNVIKDAEKDAAEFMAAQMAYGKGAGTRRKHIAHVAAYKTERISGYGEAFDAFRHRTDPTKLIQKAHRQRRAKDAAEVTSRNIKAVARGDRNGMSAPIIIGVVAFAVAHQTGYDKKIWEYTKQKSKKARAWLKEKL